VVVVYIRCVQRPFRRRCGRGGTREGSRLGSRGRRRHTMGTALYMHVYYIIRRAPRVCTTQEGSLWGVETIGGATAAAKYNQTNVQYYYIYTYQIPITKVYIYIYIDKARFGYSTYLFEQRFWSTTLYTV